MMSNWNKKFVELKVKKYIEKQKQIIAIENINRKYLGKSKIKGMKLQPYTILDHLGSYGLEGYGVYPAPNSYGLHDDGTNIFTVRQDDLPFSDVDYAFAVEEGTTNLVTNGGFETGDLTGWTTQTAYGGATYSVVSEKSYEGSYSVKIVTDGTATGAPGIISDKVAVTEGLDYTASAFVNGNYADNYVWILIRWYDNLNNVISSSVYGYAVNMNSSKFIQISTTETAPTGATQAEIHIRIEATQVGTLYIDAVQLEGKSFATSFVDGTRTTGNLQFDFNYSSDFVIDFWAKQTCLSSGVRRLFEISDDDNLNYDGRMLLYYNGTDLMWYYDPADGSAAQALTITLDWDLTQWHRYTILYDGTTWKLYVDGILKSSWILTIDFIPQYIKLGQNFYLTANNGTFGLFSNIYFGSYDSTVWTDTFIQELYNKQVLAKALKQIEKSPTPPSALQNKYGITKMGELLLQDPDLWNMWFNKYNFDRKALSAGYQWGV